MPAALRDLTLIWVDEWFCGHYGELIFTKDKGEAAKQLKLTGVPTFGIDDHARNYDALTAAGVTTFLMNKPWNQGHAVPTGRRVKSISEFAGAIEKEITS
jgi:hypothetical protein